MPRLRGPCRLKRVCMWLVVSVGLCLGVALSVAQYYVRCSNGRAADMISGLCEAYRNHEVVGNMCWKLCEEDAFRFTECGNNRWGKIVALLQCEGCDKNRRVSNVVLKSQYDMANWRNIIDISFKKNESLESMVERTSKRLKDHVKFYFGTHLQPPEDVISFIWRQSFGDFLKKADFKDAGKVALTSVLALGLQLEYISMIVFGEQPYLPKVYGTCGSAYIVESTPAITKMGYVLFQGKLPDILSLAFNTKSWRDRADIALKLLDFMEVMENSKSSPLHLCDWRPHNIGLNYKNEISLFDSDSVRFSNMLPEGKNCSSDSECQFLDCHGFCKPDTKTCGGVRINNNLQVLCKNTFLSLVEHFGLLRDPPSSVASELRSALYACAYSKQYKDGFEWHLASKEQGLEIKRLLERSLS